MKATFVASVLLCTLSFSVFPSEDVAALIKTDKVDTIQQKINLNTADIHLLIQSIKGIGIKRAQAIITYREKNGPFKSIEELAKVPSIGEKFVSKNLSQIKEAFTTE